MKKYIIYFICYFAFQSLFAQDPIFTQFYASPMLINPSFAGSEGNTRIGLGHRNQWIGNNNKLSTSYVFADKWIESMNSGLGLSIINQKEELTNYSFTQINLSYSYHLKITEKYTFFPGISFGYGSKQFNFNNLLLGDQINIYNGITSPSIDPIIERDNVIFFDMSLGGVFYSNNLWIGLSLKHLTKPNISFVENKNSPLPMLFSFHGGYKLPLNKHDKNYFLSNNSFLFLTFNYLKQDEFNRFDFGAEFQFSKIYLGILASTELNKTSESSRNFLSINPIIGLEFKNLKIGFSYDFPTSNIGNIAGTSEITLQYFIKNKTTRERIWQTKH